jgi:inner membrane transporter RhtA
VDFRNRVLTGRAIAVGVCSSVIPYLTDQVAMARLRRPTYALMLSLLPASGTVIGLLVLAQRPAAGDLLGVAMVVAAVAIHQQPAGTDRAPPRPAPDPSRLEGAPCGTSDWVRPG